VTSSAGLGLKHLFDLLRKIKFCILNLVTVQKTPVTRCLYSCVHSVDLDRALPGTKFEFSTKLFSRCIH
jgi:hypothetical protein